MPFQTPDSLFTFQPFQIMLYLMVSDYFAHSHNFSLHFFFNSFLLNHLIHFPKHLNRANPLLSIAIIPLQLQLDQLHKLLNCPSSPISAPGPQVPIHKKVPIQLEIAPMPLKPSLLYSLTIYYLLEIYKMKTLILVNTFHYQLYSFIQSHFVYYKIIERYNIYLQLYLYVIKEQILFLMVLYLLVLFTALTIIPIDYFLIYIFILKLIN